MTLGNAGVYIWPFLGLPDLPSALLLVVGLAGILIGAPEWGNARSRTAVSEAHADMRFVVRLVAAVVLVLMMLVGGALTALGARSDFVGFCAVVACFFPAAVLLGTAHLRRATVTATILGVALGLSVIALLMYQSGNWGGPYPG
ncbi:hypothetical protein OCAE111667_04490 [Occultella aeris]|uniref:Uncharacterized protein n=1 Tax=Occultella aeris TaxID=2761496 RepID=A0A7M4DG16_9MICO|nr:hypothetical protein [Occultella aeris]VZO35859.1 hypothetical protein HALOF300_01061 [Occultella aeris]